MSDTVKKPIEYERLVDLWGSVLERTTAPLTRKELRAQKEVKAG